MEDVRERSEYKHVCKRCFKSYPSGKSLGGHMRSHVINDAHKAKALLKQQQLLLQQQKKNKMMMAMMDSSSNHHHHHNDRTNDHKVANFDDQYENEEDENNGGHSHSVYGLRENPKKSWRAVDSLSTKPPQAGYINGNVGSNGGNQERVCKQCGKGFQSLKALCGHMSSHSEKDRNLMKANGGVCGGGGGGNEVDGGDDDGDDDDDDDQSWSSESHSGDAVAIHSLTSSAKRQTRSSLSRYRSLTNVDSLGGGGSSSNNSEIDQLEQEEVAICLMMLSRDSSPGSKNWVNNFTAVSVAAPASASVGATANTAESSDNNSVILEGGGVSTYCKKDVILIKKKMILNKKKFDDDDDEKVNVGPEMDNSDSGYFENGAKELESDGSVDGNYMKSCYYYKSSNFDDGVIKKPKVDYGSGLVDSSYVDSRKRLRDGRTFGFDFDSPESENSSKKIKQDYYENGGGDNSVKGSSKYECSICNKSFRTHQALGGHIISHRKNGETNSLDYTTASNSPNTKTASSNKTVATSYAKKGVGSKKVKGHKCPYCDKVYPSGQALGGHKRSHMMGSGGINHILTEEKAVLPPEPEQRQQPTLIDLNLPAPVEEEASGNSHFVAW